MPLTSSSSLRVALLFSLECFLGGCTHPSSIPTIEMPSLPERKTADRGIPPDAQGGGGPYLPVFQIPAIDLAWLDSDGLIPPAAKIVMGDEPAPRSLVSTPRAAYPSSATCKSPDDEWLLLSEAIPRRGKMVHWLHAFKRGETPPADIFQTEFFFDVLWAPNSHLIAVTEYSGRNSSQIFFVNVSTAQKSDYVDVGAALEPYFSEEQRSWARFQKAYRWSESGLVVRGIAHAAEPPFEQIGYEVLLHVDDVPGVAKMGLIRGYTKHPKS